MWDGFDPFYPATILRVKIPIRCVVPKTLVQFLHLKVKHAIFVRANALLFFSLARVSPDVYILGGGCFAVKAVERLVRWPSGSARTVAIRLPDNNALTTQLSPHTHLNRLPPTPYRTYLR